MVPAALWFTVNRSTHARMISIPCPRLETPGTGSRQPPWSRTVSSALRKPSGSCTTRPRTSTAPD